MKGNNNRNRFPSSFIATNGTQLLLRVLHRPRNDFPVRDTRRGLPERPPPPVHRQTPTHAGHLLLEAHSAPAGRPAHAASLAVVQHAERESPAQRPQGPGGEGQLHVGGVRRGGHRRGEVGLPAHQARQPGAAGDAGLDGAGQRTECEVRTESAQEVDFERVHEDVGEARVEAVLVEEFSTA